jgi:hypothetical protein
MTVTKEVQEKKQEIDVLDIAYKLVLAVLATLAVVRSAQAATRAWQRVGTAIRPQSEAEEQKES